MHKQHRIDKHKKRITDNIFNWGTCLVSYFTHQTIHQQSSGVDHGKTDNSIGTYIIGATSDPHASETNGYPLAPFVWDKTVKTSILRDLQQYKDMKKNLPAICEAICRSRNYTVQDLATSLTNNDGLTSFISLHDAIEKDNKPSRKLIAGARSLLSQALLKDKVQDEWTRSQKKAYVWALTKEPYATEREYKKFKNELATGIETVLKQETGIALHPVDGAFNGVFERVALLQSLSTLSAKQSARLKQAQLALFQIHPFVQREITQIRECKTRFEQEAQAKSSGQ